MGQAGRKAIKKYVPELRKKYALDAVIINGENAAHGLGLTPKTYKELLNASADVITMGNHTFDKMDVIKIWAEENVLVRPLNYPSDTVGKGYQIIEVAGKRLCVVQVLGRAFMNSKLELADPFQTMQNFVEEHQSEYDLLVVDYHAETTAEKVVMGYFLDGKATLVVGTHTHIPTNDAHILPKGTAFISDVGMTGYADGVLGSTSETVVNKLIYGQQSKFQVPDEGRGLFSAVIIDVDDITGLAKQIFPIYYLENEN